MGKLVQYTDLSWYPTESIRREYRRTIYDDGMVGYEPITETDRSYSSVELTEGRCYDQLFNSMECQRKRNERRSDA